MILCFFMSRSTRRLTGSSSGLKRLRRRGHGFKSHPTDWEKPGIGPATPGLQDIGLSPTPRRLLYQFLYARCGGYFKFKKIFFLKFIYGIKVIKGAKIRNRYNQVPHLTKDTNGKVTNSQ